MSRINKAALIATKNYLMEVFESNRVFLQISATVLSCGAAWMTYRLRRSHNRKMEEKIEAVNTEIRKNQSHVTGSPVSATSPPGFSPTLRHYAIGISVTLAVGYFVGFRHARTFYNRSSGPRSNGFRVLGNGMPSTSNGGVQGLRTGPNGSQQFFLPVCFAFPSRPQTTESCNESRREWKQYLL